MDKFNFNREMQFPDFVIFNYLIMKNDSFPDPKTATDAKYSNNLSLIWFIEHDAFISFEESVVVW